MHPRERWTERMARAADGAGADGLGAIVVGPSPDLAYLTGYDPPPFERPTLLVLRPDLAKPIRAQGVFVSDNEISAISHHWTTQAGLRYDRSDKVVEGPDRLTRRDMDGDEPAEDDRYSEAVDIVMNERKASVSMLQRKMTIGFARAGRLIDMMERHGVIGPDRGPGKFREVYGAPGGD